MEFSFTDLLKRFWHYAWLTVLLMVVFAGLGFVGAKHAKTTTDFSANRSVLMAKNNTDVKDPNSRFLADKALMPTYEKIAKDDAVLTTVKSALPFKMTKDEINTAVTVSNPTDTVMLDFKASAGSTYRSKTLVNAYAEAFAKEGQRLYPDMGQPNVLSKATASDVTHLGGKSTKKLTLFGAFAGLVIGLFVVLLTGIVANYQQAKKQN
ncbi:capsular biosynthesis protein [Leuconostocaceae bacterium ESL0958]|nr:capsular biosynthesis protein [Leuconostocaceae bacterium ESL0958]